MEPKDKDEALKEFCRDTGLSEDLMRRQGFYMELCPCGCSEWRLMLPKVPHGGINARQ